jgi:hypothetical protein
MVGTAMFIRAPAAFWDAASRSFNGGKGFTPTRAAELASSWVQVQANGAVYVQFAALVDRHGFLNSTYPVGMPVKKSPGGTVLRLHDRRITAVGNHHK